MFRKKQIQNLKKAYLRKQAFNKKEADVLYKYLKYYKIEKKHSTLDQIKLLELKINTVPTSFVLAQAILESGWGTSRFAKN